MLGLVHDDGINLHEDEIDDVEDDKDERLPPGELRVPREDDETHQGQTVEETITRQRAPVQIKNLWRRGNRHQMVNYKVLDWCWDLLHKTYH